MFRFHNSASAFGNATFMFHRRNRSLGSLLTYEGLPDSLKSEVLVRAKIEEDPEELKARQELVKAKTPAQLASMSGPSDFPLPRMIDTMVRPGRRTLKSTKQKELEKKKRYVHVHNWHKLFTSSIFPPQP